MQVVLDKNFIQVETLLRAHHEVSLRNLLEGIEGFDAAKQELLNANRQYFDCVNINFRLDNDFRHYLEERFETESAPQAFVDVAHRLGFKSWDSLGSGEGPARLPEQADVDAFEQFMLQFRADWEATGIPAERARLKAEAEQQELQRLTKCYAKLVKRVPAAVKKAESAEKRGYYDVFSKTLGKYEGFRYYTGALLAQQVNSRITGLPLEVGIGLVAANKFFNDNRRWPRFPFSIDRLASTLTEL